MSELDLDAALRSFEREAFRLEVLPAYNVPEERDNLARYLAGDPLRPDPRRPWIDFIESSVRSGKRIDRVHILPGRLTPYLRFEIEWGYLYSAQAGEEIFLLPQSDATPELLDRATLDFWLFDDTIGFMMEYDEMGRFLGSAPVTSSARISELTALKLELLKYATPLREWLARERSK